MRIVVFSDLHGNIETFQKMVDKEREHTDHFLCLGDLVGYLPFANECLELLSTLPYSYVLGNHEEMFIAGKAAENCSAQAKEFFNYAYPHFEKKYIPLLQSLPQHLFLHNFNVQHTVLDRYIYPNTPIELLAGLEGNFFIGHSHCQFMMKNQTYMIVNPGSLGQNRKQKTHANYAVWLPETNSISFETIYNSNNNLRENLIELGYPETLTAYYCS